MDISQALKSLCPNSEFIVEDNNYNKITWFEKNQDPLPSEEEILNEIENLKNEYEKNQYQVQRKIEYPTIQDQLDMLYHLGYDGWKMEINKVKDKYPKPE